MKIAPIVEFAIMIVIVLIAVVFLIVRIAQIATIVQCVMLAMIVKVLLLVNTVLIVIIVWDLLMKSTNIIKLVQYSIVILQHGFKLIEAMIMKLILFMRSVKKP